VRVLVDSVGAHHSPTTGKKKEKKEKKRKKRRRRPSINWVLAIHSIQCDSLGFSQPKKEKKKETKKVKRRGGGGHAAFIFRWSPTPKILLNPNV